MNIKKTISARLVLTAATILISTAAFAQAPPAPDRVRQYTYDAAGNITSIGDDVFVYDSVDRVVSGKVSGRERLYEYDAFGNRLDCTDVNSGSKCQFGAQIDSTLNRITAADYDGAGNLTTFAGQTYQYDSLGMLVSRDNGATEYVYTADDGRIAIVGANQWRWTLRNASNKVLREVFSTANVDGTHSNWQWRRDNVFRDGTLLSSVDSSGTRHYHTDHLGTPRVVTNTTGMVLGVHDYFAFGLEVPENITETDPGRLRFTGHERDADGLDYMHARFYEPKWGRFLSFDPVWASADVSSPQRWNRYAYVLNNPIKSYDPTGRDTISISIGLYGGGGGALSGKISINFDDDLNYSITTPRAIGGGSPAVEIPISLNWNWKADTVDDLITTSAPDMSFSVGGGVGWTGGFELGASPDGIQSIEIGGGPGIDAGADAHALFEWTPEAHVRGNWGEEIVLPIIDKMTESFQKDMANFLNLEPDPTEEYIFILKEPDPEQ